MNYYCNTLQAISSSTVCMFTWIIVATQYRPIQVQLCVHSHELSLQPSTSHLKFSSVRVHLNYCSNTEQTMSNSTGRYKFQAQQAMIQDIEKCNVCLKKRKCRIHQWVKLPHGLRVLTPYLLPVINANLVHSSSLRLSLVMWWAL
mgnify:CR=1 FL=1